MSQVLRFPNRIAETLAGDFFVHRGEEGDLLWIQPGSSFPDGRPLLFLLQRLQDGKLRIDDRGETSRYLSPSIVETPFGRVRLDRALEAFHVFRDDWEHRLFLVTTQNELPKSVHQLRRAVESVLQQFA